MQSVQVLIPACFLTEIGAVIDMVHLKIMYMNLGVKQSMVRLTLGPVGVSVVEFGRGCHVRALHALAAKPGQPEPSEWHGISRRPSFSDGSANWNGFALCGAR